MKYIIIILLTLPIFCNAQKAIDTVKLKNNKYAALYANGTWKYVSLNTQEINTATSTRSTAASRTGNAYTPATKSSSSYTKPSSGGSYSSTCGAPTKKGGACRRVVSGGGRCWQH